MECWGQLPCTSEPLLGRCRRRHLSLDASVGTSPAALRSFPRGSAPPVQPEKVPIIPWATSSLDSPMADMPIRKPCSVNHHTELRLDSGWSVHTCMQLCLHQDHPHIVSISTAVLDRLAYRRLEFTSHCYFTVSLFCYCGSAKQNMISQQGSIGLQDHAPDGWLSGTVNTHRCLTTWNPLCVLT